MAGLTPLDEALALILADSGGAPPALEYCSLADALGRVLAQTIVADVAVPPAADSAMDGYAIRTAEAARPLPISQRIPAGHCGLPLAVGTAARIFTGAPLPPGADAVVMQEHCAVRQGRLTVLQPPVAGENIRPAGQSIARGDRLLPAGRRLRAEDLGLLAAVGCARVPVRQRLTVAILASGDELVEPVPIGTHAAGPAAVLQPGQIFNSNRYLLQGLLQELGCVVKDFGVARDSAAETAELLTRAAAAADCVISSGGVSVGEEDHIKTQLEKLGELTLWKLSIKPGKPLAYGRIGSTPVFGLPGNPVAVFVTFAIVLRPWLQQRQAALPSSDQPPLELQAIADFALPSPDSRRQYLRARVFNAAGELHAALHPNQSSAVLSSVSWANALVVLAAGTTVAPGDRVTVLLLDQLKR